jgi:hypothetical protein
MFTFEELSALFAAIWSTWVSALTGVIGLALTAIALFWPNLPNRRIFSVVGIVVLVISPIYAWRDEHRLRIAVEPVLKAQINTYRGFEVSDGIMLAVLISVRNTGPVPTTAHSFRLTLHPLRLDEMGPFAPNYYDVMRFIKTGDGSQMYVFKKESSVFETMSKPILQGEIRRGWLIYKVVGLRWVDMHNGQLSMSFRDTTEKRYTVKSSKMTSMPNPPEDELRAFPGVEPEIEERKYRE